ncbi:hypothetical protein C5167_041965 [Papaver somniferum]|nr:hypothetical protein C5167_041965 [Papaver somniferum]
MGSSEKAFWEGGWPLGLQPLKVHRRDDGHKYYLRAPRQPPKVISALSISVP